VARGWTALTAIALLTLVLVPSAGGHRGTPCPTRGALLPDLVQEVPSDITVDLARSGSHVTFRLGFSTTMGNIGEGPLEVVGHRSPGEPSMSAEQLIALRSGGTCRRSAVGTVRYDFRKTHEHWHLLGFDRYSLLRPSGTPAPAPTRKAGFCLGDRVGLTQDLRHAAARARWITDCAIDEPHAARVVEGISVGWADIYEAYIEGQLLDITKLTPGRYVLANTVNPNRRLRESRYGNNSASVLIDLRWPQGRDRFPTVRVLATCPGRLRCGKR
jgi:hypothetical protein